MSQNHSQGRKGGEGQRVLFAQLSLIGKQNIPQSSSHPILPLADALSCLTGWNSSHGHPNLQGQLGKQVCGQLARGNCVGVDGHLPKRQGSGGASEARAKRKAVSAELRDVERTTWIP